MKDLIEVLIDFEKSACKYYDSAAQFFNDDRMLADNLKRLADVG